MAARPGRIRLVNKATVRAGKPMAPHPPQPLAPWAEVPEHQRAMSM
jgi:hypothetical protein